MSPSRVLGFSVSLTNRYTIDANALSDHFDPVWAIPPTPWGLLSRWHRQMTTTPETNEPINILVSFHSPCIINMHRLKHFHLFVSVICRLLQRTTISSISCTGTISTSNTTAVLWSTTSKGIASEPRAATTERTEAATTTAEAWAAVEWAAAVSKSTTTPSHVQQSTSSTILQQLLVVSCDWIFQF